jgi:hypothetical protein
MGEAARIWTTVGANIAPLKAGLAEAGAATNRFGSTFSRSMMTRTREMERFGHSWTRNVSDAARSRPGRSRRRCRWTSSATWR